MAEINAVEKKVFGQIAWEKCKQKLTHCEILKEKVGICMVEKCTVGKSMAGMLGNACG